MATTTPKPTTLEVDALTGVETVRELTAEELAQREVETIQYTAQAAAQEAKAAARQSALAKLAELGLTEEEIQAL